MGKIGRANCLADLGYQRAEYLVQPTNEHCLGEGFGPAAAGQKCRTEATIDLLTYCVLVLKNGHTVSGEAYCADPAKFNAETGRIEARKVAINR